MPYGYQHVWSVWICSKGRVGRTPHYYIFNREFIKMQDLMSRAMADIAVVSSEGQQLADPSSLSPGQGGSVPILPTSYERWKK
jgi:hypothetical protein